MKQTKLGEESWMKIFPFVAQLAELLSGPIISWAVLKALCSITENTAACLPKEDNTRPASRVDTTWRTETLKHCVWWMEMEQEVRSQREASEDGYSWLIPSGNVQWKQQHGCWKHYKHEGDEKYSSHNYREAQNLLILLLKNIAAC